MTGINDNRRAPDDLTGLPLVAKILFVVLWIAGMALFVIFVLPLIDAHIATPFSEWGTNLIFGPKTPS